MDPKAVERWFKVATFGLGFALVTFSAVLYAVEERVSWELLVVGTSFMGTPAFIGLDRKARNGSNDTLE